MIPKSARNLIQVKTELNVKTQDQYSTLVKKKRVTSRQPKTGLGTDLKLSSIKNESKPKKTKMASNIKNLEYVSVKKITLNRCGSAQMEDINLFKKPKPPLKKQNSSKNCEI